jgi:hypothetical protein
MRSLLARHYRSHASLAILFLSLTAAACSSSSTKTNPDAQPDVNLGTDTSDAPLPDSASLDTSSESQGEAGQAGQLTVSPASIDLGSIQPGTQSPSQTVTVTTVSDISDLTVRLLGNELTLAGGSTCTRSLAAGTSCVEVITFLSTTTGAKSASVVIVAGGQSTVVPVTAQVRVGGRLVLSPSSPQAFLADIGQSSAPITFGLANTGDTEVGPVTVTITGPNAADFTATPTGCDRLAPGASCAIDVVFSSKAASAVGETATLVVTGPAPDFYSATIALFSACYGMCGEGTFLSPPTSDLGTVAVGATGPAVTFTLTNNGQRALGPFTVVLSNSEFVNMGDTCSTSVLPAGGTCTISVALRPTSEGGKSATLSVTSTSGSPSVKTLAGTGMVGLDGGLGGPVDSGQAQAEAGGFAFDGSSRLSTPH